MTTNERPTYDIVQYNAIKTIYDRIDFSNFFSMENSRFKCKKSSRHGIICKKNGYAEEGYCKRHVLDQHLSHSYRFYNCLVCNYRGLQHCDLKGHMESGHPDLFQKYNDPQQWNEVYPGLHQAQGYDRGAVDTARAEVTNFGAVAGNNAGEEDDVEIVVV